ncbi:MAG: hypothetical protein HRU09_15440 [Oligoflexales bacterium]|nr:hypothetical protein [Oligoflexales bacterium]
MTVIKRELCTCDECGTNNVVEYPLFETWFEYYNLRERYHDKMINYSNNAWTYPAHCKKCQKEYQRPVAGVYKRTFGCDNCNEWPYYEFPPLQDESLHSDAPGGFRRCIG